MSSAATAARRYLVRMDGAAAYESTIGHLVTVIVAALGGGLGLEAFKRWADRRKKAAAQPLEFTARVLDEGDTLRRLLMEEATALRQENREIRERAHAAELQLAVLAAEHVRLKVRLERKDQQARMLRMLLIEHEIPIPEMTPADAPAPEE
jgi:hypothetical protein